MQNNPADNRHRNPDSRDRPPIVATGIPIVATGPETKNVALHKSTMVYTLVLRSENRTNSEDKTNNCRIRHGMDRAVADIDNWRVTVKQFLIPKSVDSNSDSTIYGY